MTAVSILLDDQEQRLPMAGLGRGAQRGLAFGKADAGIGMTPVNRKQEEVCLRYPLTRERLGAARNYGIEPLAERDLGSHPLEPESLLVRLSMGGDFALIGDRAERSEIKGWADQLGELDGRLGGHRVKRR